MTDMRTPRRRARGLGAAGSGSMHFWMQRVTAIANVPLVIFLLSLLVALIGLGHEAARSYIANPLVGIMLILLVVSGAFHMRLGMQVIIEDYIHSPAIKMACLVGNILFSAAIGIACIYAVLRTSLGS
ncbi:succinate dehydrogenase, hydrophobic membrane anchor protein [Sphingobium indicum]|nr:succinate dehydrogenase, hydrophobic membrane anchor protein [Sphingobium indicum]